MKLYHLADLHFGKSVYGIPLAESGDQKYWTERFLELCEKERPDAVMIAGDVYDRSAPSGEAVELLDRLISGLADMDIPVMVIAGNHDSPQRLSFGSSLMARQNVYIAGSAEKELRHVTFDDPDGYGPVTFWLMPYVFPELVAGRLEAEDIRTYDDAVRRLLAVQPLDPEQRNVIIAHQNVTFNGREAERGGSESMVGGVGQVDCTAFDIFEYAALGHIHSAYHVGRKEVRYAGTPLCYHLEETRQKEKGVTEVILGEKGTVPKIRIIPIEPLHKMRFLKDTKEAVYKLLKEDTGRDEYVGITLTDERITPEISSYLRSLLKERGSILIELLSDHTSFASHGASAEAEAVEKRAVEDLFSDLYTEQNGGTPPDDTEYAVMQYVGELVRNRDTHLPAEPADIDRILAFAQKTGGEKK